MVCGVRIFLATRLQPAQVKWGGGGSCAPSRLDRASAPTLDLSGRTMTRLSLYRQSAGDGDVHVTGGLPFHFLSLLTPRCI